MSYIHELAGWPKLEWNDAKLLPLLAFLKWFEFADKVDPVLKAGVAHFWFVTIHPFEDGNGRISRAIADLSLARAEGTKERFYSMSAQIEAEKKQYYLNLKRSQKGGLILPHGWNGFLAVWGGRWMAQGGTTTGIARGRWCEVDDHQLASVCQGDVEAMEMK